MTLVDHIIPGRSDEARPGNRVEHRRTAVLVVPLDSASLKVRSGGPTDEPEDIATGGWAGVIPLQIGVGAPVPDDLSADLDVPPSIAGFRRP